MEQLTDRKLKEMDFHDRRERDRQAMSEEEWQARYSNKKWYAVTEHSRAFVSQWLNEACKGRVVLDFGCGLGGMSLELARAGAYVYAIDISPESVAQTCKVLEENGFAEHSSCAVMDAEDLRFPDDTFDVIICSGVLHHMDVTLAFPALARVLKPSGKIIAIEALGYNPIISLYRKLTPKLRTEWEANHILTYREIGIARKFFAGVDIRYFHLFTIMAVPFRKSRIFRPFLAALRAADSALLRIPGIRSMAWQMVIFLSNPRKEA